MWASRIIRSAWLIASLVVAGSTGTAASDSRAGLGPASPAPASPAAGPAASPSPEPAPELWLRGPFGRVAGGPVEAPAAAEPLGAPLDAFVRSAPLVLESDSDSLLGELTVVGHPVADPGEDIVLSEVGPGFAGPDTPGTYRIVATLGSDAGDVTEHAWLVDVPDREPPPDGLYDIPAPDVLMESADDSVAGVLGDGCYIYLCVEAGPTPPLAALQALYLQPGEVPLVRLADGSAITAWEGRLSPVGRTRGRPREAAGVLTDTTAAVIALAGLEPPATGTWRLDLEVTLDRERGWLRTTHRVVAR